MINVSLSQQVLLLIEHTFVARESMKKETTGTTAWDFDH